MSAKVKWGDLYHEFRLKFPNIAKLAIYHCPYDFMKIKIWLSDGQIILYDGDKRRIEQTNITWKKGD